MIDTTEIKNKYKVHPLLPNNMTVADLVIDVFRLCDHIDELERKLEDYKKYEEKLKKYEAEIARVLSYTKTSKQIRGE